MNLAWLTWLTCPTCGHKLALYGPGRTKIPLPERVTIIVNGQALRVDAVCKCGEVVTLAVPDPAPVALSFPQETEETEADNPP